MLFDARGPARRRRARRARWPRRRALEFIKDQYRHCKPILALGDGAALLDPAGIPSTLTDGTADPGLIVDAMRPPTWIAFVAALAKPSPFRAGNRSAARVSGARPPTQGADDHG